MRQHSTAKYDGIQLTYQISTSPVSPQNAGDADIKGLELELQALLGSHASITMSGLRGRQLHANQPIRTGH